MNFTYLIIFMLLVSVGLSLYILIRLSKYSENQNDTRIDTRLEDLIKRIAELDERLGEMKISQLETSAETRERLVTILAEHDTKFEKRQADAYKGMTESLQIGITNLQKQIGDYLNRYSEDLGKRMEGLTKQTDERLQQISGQVEKRLTQGFEKTTATFADILKRLALIDEAQKKITELSTNVVSLQEVLSDKRSRGAFGEVQLNALISNIMPIHSYQLQYSLPNNTKADCALFLPDPTGMIMIDSKFPLESYKRMTDISLPESERKAAEKQFKQDISKHIQDIASKYIIQGTTSDGAMMFIPAEAVFAEIQGHYPDLVEKSHTARVWMVSPTTLVAILNTARAVLKDAATREQVHVIQEHLGVLAIDFGRFRKRMEDLERHIRQAHEDVEKVNKSAQKITSRFDKIEKVELGHDKDEALPILPADEEEPN